MTSRRELLGPADLQCRRRRGGQRCEVSRNPDLFLAKADAEPCRKQAGDCRGSKGRCQASAAFHVTP